MRVCAISLDGFRNYTQFSAQFSPGVNVIWGENAQGKTNLLEAIGFLAGARSHRARGDKELIAFQRTQGTITAQVESRGRDFLIQAQLFRGARRKLFVNHVKLKTAGELSEILQTQGGRRGTADLSGPGHLPAPAQVCRGPVPIPKIAGPQNPDSAGLGEESQPAGGFGGL